MPTLDWTGKDKVINHHMDVPYRVLDPQYEYGDADGNMIIHGDNLSALKSLLETVRKIRKLGVENAAEILSTRDKSAALVLICCFNMKEGHYKRKRPTSGLYHCHNSVYSEEIYNSSEIVGKETKPGFSRYL